MQARTLFFLTLAIATSAHAGLPDSTGLTTVQANISTEVGEIFGAGLLDGGGELVFLLEYDPATLVITPYSSNAALYLDTLQPFRFRFESVEISNDNLVLTGQTVLAGILIEIQLLDLSVTAEDLQTAGFAQRDDVPFRLTVLADDDNDGIANNADNCSNAANPGQRDTDGDSIGNACDADLDNSCFINFADLSLMADVFFCSDNSPECQNADFDGSGTVNFLDLLLMEETFFGPPGPSAAGCN